jgi:predicted nucleic acid-binding protein
MRLVDTSAWIEYLTGSPLGTALASELPDRAQWLVPTIVQFELAKWLTREVGEDKCPATDLACAARSAMMPDDRRRS